MPHRFRIAALVSAVAALATALSACGGNSDREAAQSLLKQAFGPDRVVTSGHLSLSAQLRGDRVKGLGRPASLKVTGAFVRPSPGAFPRFSGTLNLKRPDTQPLKVRAVSTGDKGYVTLGGTAYELPKALFAGVKGQFENETRSSSTAKPPNVATLGLDPAAWLTDPKIVGHEPVAGVATAHIVAGIDTARALRDVRASVFRLTKLNILIAKQGPQLTAAGIREVADTTKRAHAEVWVGSRDKLLRRLVLRVVLERDGRTVNASLDYELSDLDRPQRIVAPARAKGPARFAELYGGASGLTEAEHEEKEKKPVKKEKRVGKRGPSRAARERIRNTKRATKFTHCIGREKKDIEKALLACKKELGLEK